MRCRVCELQYSSDNENEWGLCPICNHRQMMRVAHVNNNTGSITVQHNGTTQTITTGSPSTFNEGDIVTLQPRETPLMSLIRSTAHGLRQTEYQWNELEPMPTREVLDQQIRLQQEREQNYTQIHRIPTPVSSGLALQYQAQQREQQAALTNIGLEPIRTNIGIANYLANEYQQHQQDLHRAFLFGRPKMSKTLCKICNTYPIPNDYDTIYCTRCLKIYDIPSYHYVDGKGGKLINNTRLRSSSYWLHAVKHPAIILPQGVEWWVDGARHREDGPAVEMIDQQCWCIHGQFHRPDGPAIVGKGYEEWHLNGKLHRDGGPAVTREGGVELWYKDGKRHREGGPAVIRLNGAQEYWINGSLARIITKEDFVHRFLHLEFS